ncbi:hypothetical protein MCOR27_002955 [Pyricularia oryzae]|uniref:Glc8 protein n=3 Tax=Pyricularia TaxID=48558 RepID=A0ABQ8NCS2_PYRGI|nr:uncharacterized protein MGG_09466 [Pyricularia oryzae 70-15]KAH8847688.1 hypothetical protein MCOR01_001096 [Pyricularia oryzae]KAI6295000.1 hypothetical protein MCOR33_008003 [Pyricularia grisea]EHA52479.1 hypothetical protein MGG_09466 [Pyricularia oryzae 70-15]KAH9430381.1 hypothetical protein MCOR02_010087 [Pyricularia oryzae]KAI6256893.1 hypothetical protein MCOR19_006651 [Pyricularia oryzae]
MATTMSTTMSTSPVPHSPPGHDAKRPKGILKNSFRGTPPVSPTAQQPSAAPDAQLEQSTPQSPRLTDKEVTIQNTQRNAGHRRSSSAARPAGSRRQSSRTPSHSGEADGEEEEAARQRLKWDEANLYLTEQERSSTMKIDEPKTPYAKHYDPAEDPSDDEMENGDGSGGSGRRAGSGTGQDDIPGLSLGEPEEAVPDDSGRTRAVHVDEVQGSGHDNDEDGMAGLSAEEREKHRKFEEMRKKHYEMRDAAQLLGHPEDLDDMDEDEDDSVPAVPPMPNGRA